MVTHQLSLLHLLWGYSFSKKGGKKETRGRHPHQPHLLPDTAAEVVVLWTRDVCWPAAGHRAGGWTDGLSAPGSSTLQITAQAPPWLPGWCYRQAVPRDLITPLGFGSLKHQVLDFEIAGWQGVGRKTGAGERQREAEWQSQIKSTITFWSFGILRKQQ